MAKKDGDWTEMIILILLMPVLILVFLIWLLFIVVSSPVIFADKQWLKFQFWQRHGRHGRFVVFVYSESPHWKEYIEANILPHLEPHVITLNWSQRREWRSRNPFAAQILNEWAGAADFNPMALVFSPEGVKDVRFVQAFRDFKHGKITLLKQTEQVLFAEVERIASQAA